MTHASTMLVAAMLALAVLGCRTDGTYPDETTPPAPMTHPGPIDKEPPIIEDEKDEEDDDDWDSNPPPTPADDGKDPAADVPEAETGIGAPQTDPKKPPPPSASRG